MSGSVSKFVRRDAGFDPSGRECMQLSAHKPSFDLITYGTFPARFTRRNEATEWFCVLILLSIHREL
jgi:hypothetical protein